MRLGHRAHDTITSRVKGIWKCKGIDSGTVFAEVDMAEGEWTDYDEKVSFINSREADS